jgi:succinate dehydrogenase / fumarate reductase flavoprotein subunit
MAGPYETHEHDVLVIGAGGAGLRAAIAACHEGVSVGLVCKSLLGKAHTVMAEGGVAASLGNVEPKDNWQVHFRDTMRGGKMLNNWRMAQLHAQEAPDRVKELEAWGALFDRTTDGRILQRNFGGHTYPRLAHVGDRTGLEMIRTLQDATVQAGAKVYMECTIYRLLTTDGRVVGAIGYWRESGKFVIFRAKAIVVATGGLGKSWRVTSNSWEYTGDGHAMAYDAGADLIDMEFVQFHPTGMVWPPSVRGTLITEGVRGEGGVLRNSANERFMFRYVPAANKGEFAETEEETREWLRQTELKQQGKAKHVTARRPPELLTRDVVAKAINKEVAEGRGSPHAGVFLDIHTQRSAEDIKRKLPSMYHQFKELAEVDITAEPMEVGPTCHYAMGGVRVEADTAAATVNGLFAAGEAAGGMHGANRLGGNSLSDLLVFGRRAGLSAAALAKASSDLPALDDGQVETFAHSMLAPLERSEGENPFAVHSALQDVMERYVGIIRNKKDLEQGIQELDKLRRRAAAVKSPGTRHFNPGWHMALDLQSMLICSEACARAALAREESRGAHTRDDFADTRPEFGAFNLVVHEHGGAMTVRREPLPPMPVDLKAVVGGK